MIFFNLLSPLRRFHRLMFSSRMHRPHPIHQFPFSNGNLYRYDEYIRFSFVTLNHTISIFHDIYFYGDMKISTKIILFDHTMEGTTDNVEWFNLNARFEKKNMQHACESNEKCRNVWNGTLFDSLSSDRMEYLVVVIRTRERKRERVASDIQWWRMNTLFAVYELCMQVVKICIECVAH